MFLKRDNYCIIEEHKFFTEFNDSRRLLDGSQKFKMLEVKKNQLRHLKVGKNCFIVELSYL